MFQEQGTSSGIANCWNICRSFLLLRLHRSLRGFLEFVDFAEWLLIGYICNATSASALALVSCGITPAVGSDVKLLAQEFEEDLCLLFSKTR